LTIYLSVGNIFSTFSFAGVQAHPAGESGGVGEAREKRRREA
jgi:hypothetical protein